MHLSPTLQGEKRAEFVGFVCREGQSKQSHICHIFRAASQAMVSSTIDTVHGSTIDMLYQPVCVQYVSMYVYVSSHTSLEIHAHYMWGRWSSVSFPCTPLVTEDLLYVTTSYSAHRSTYRVLPYFVLRQEASNASDSFGN